jgi:ubiquinone/menaquinone biosynthesis C-methylase UbiE
MNDDKTKAYFREMFNRGAVSYEKSYAGRHSGRLKKAAVARLDESPRGSVLDVGCGPGILLTTLAASYPELKLAGLDLAPEMVRIATERMGNRAEIRLGDAESLPWESASFDYIFCIDSFHHYPNPKKALSEFHRVLKPWGRVVLADPTAPFLVRYVLNSLVRLLHMGGVHMYNKRDLAELFGKCSFQMADWWPEGSLGFIATGRAI